MSRKRKKSKDKASGPPPRAVRQDQHSFADGQPTPQEVFRELLSNKPGLFGFLLSFLQLLGHASWIFLVWYLSVTGKAASLTSDSWMSWLIVGLLGVSLILTFVSMFVCLYYGLRRAPRILPVMGFAVSFFVGVLASGFVFMQGIRAMSGK